jgi:hypothetical protein
MTAIGMDIPLALSPSPPCKSFIDYGAFDLIETCWSSSLTQYDAWGCPTPIPFPFKSSERTSRHYNGVSGTGLPFWHAWEAHQMLTGVGNLGGWIVAGSTGWLWDSSRLGPSIQGANRIWNPYQRIITNTYSSSGVVFFLHMGASPSLKVCL